MPFLLITAVFSRITILELNLPTGESGSAQKKNEFSVEVTVRSKGLELGNGKSIIARFPKVEDEYDFKQLARYLLEIKSKYPAKTNATVLMEPDIEYDYLIRVMDVVRSAEIKRKGEETVAGAAEGVEEALEEGADAVTKLKEIQRVELFPDISIGDAP